MSIALLHNNSLYADSLGLDCTSYPYTFSPMKKLFVSKHKDVAFTVIGDALAEDDKDDFITEVIKIIYGTPIDPVYDATKGRKRIDILINRSVIVMTLDSAYYVTQGIHVEIKNIHGTTFASGDNRMPVLAALSAGLSPFEAIDMSHTVAHGTHPHYPISEVVQSDLPAFNIDNYLTTTEDKTNDQIQ